MRTMLRCLSLPVLALFLLAGCASSRDPATVQYKEIQDETVYRARSMNLGTMFPTGGLSRDPSVRLRSWATCPGQNCRPQEVWFSFLLRTTNAPTNVLSSRDVKIQTDGNVHTWPEGEQRFAGKLKTSKTQLQVPGGGSGNELVRISMKMSTLQDIAQSKHMSGTLGSEDFSLSYEDRAPLRALIEQIRHPSEEQAL